MCGSCMFEGDIGKDMIECGKCKSYYHYKCMSSAPSATVQQPGNKETAQFSW